MKLDYVIRIIDITLIYELCIIDLMNNSYNK